VIDEWRLMIVDLFAGCFCISIVNQKPSIGNASLRQTTFKTKQK